MVDTHTFTYTHTHTQARTHLTAKPLLDEEGPCGRPLCELGYGVDGRVVCNLVSPLLLPSKFLAALISSYVCVGTVCLEGQFRFYEGF